MCQSSPRIDRSAPRVTLHEELSELPMREDAVVTRRWGEARQARETGKHVHGIERSPERALDLLA